MKKLVCEICGSSQIEKKENHFACGVCGCIYTPEQVRGLLQDVSDTAPAAVVTPAPEPPSTELDNLYQLARRAREQNNAENAARYYDQIAMRNPTCWEACFFQVYYQSASCRIVDIHSAANRVKNCHDATMELIAKYVPKEKQLPAVVIVQQYTMTLAQSFFDTAENYYNNIDPSIRYQHGNETYDRMAAACDCDIFCGNAILKHFQNDKIIMKAAVSAWDTGIKLCNRLIRYASNTQHLYQIISQYSDLCLKYDEEKRKKQEESAKKDQQRELRSINAEIATLRRLKAEEPENRRFRLIMYVLAALSVIPPLAIFAYCSRNFIVVGMLVCFVLAIVFPNILIKVAQNRPVPPRNVDAQIRQLVSQKKKLEEQLQTPDRS
ncbi:MAG: hypothetical protein IKU07_01700 [Oscillospiraceae bacterium]|nr:hypothetical protein [Oscillospiraceae bacterium]